MPRRVQETPMLQLLGVRAKNIDYNRMELRKIWHDGRFSVRANESSSVVPAAELLISCGSPRKIITVTCGDKIEGKLHHAQLVLAKF